MGPDNAATRQLIEAEKGRWADREQLRTHRARLVRIALAGGMAPVSAQEGRILRLLERGCVFAAGGVLVGRPAFRVLDNSLGVRWARTGQTR